MRRHVQAFAVLASALAAGCSSTSNGTSTGLDTGIPDGCAPLYQSDADLTAPSVSFANDILPIFQQNCSVDDATCHGAPSVTQQQRPFLGATDGGTPPAVILAGLGYVASSEDPKMLLVDPGQPEASFLMHKMDFDACNFAADCAKGSTPYKTCGIGMPYTDPILPADVRDTVRRWIAQGAQNN